MNSPENKHTSNIIQTDKIVFRNIFVYSYSYMHIIKLVKRKEKYEGSRERLYEQVWREEKVINILVKLCSQK